MIELSYQTLIDFVLGEHPCTTWDEGELLLNVIVSLIAYAGYSDAGTSRFKSQHP